MSRYGKYLLSFLQDKDNNMEIHLTAILLKLQIISKNGCLNYAVSKANLSQK